LLLFLLSLFSFLAKEQHIATAALMLALLSTLHHTHIQQRRIEKLEDEYRVQRDINQTAEENHRAAYPALQQKVHAASSGNTSCTRTHCEHPSAETIRGNRQLKDRLNRLRLSGKTTTYTRTHNDRSTAKTTCANRVLHASTRKLRVTVTSLKSDIDHRERTVKSLRRSLKTDSAYNASRRG
jgi:hypothetical protein